MSNELQEKLNAILNDKNTNLLPENLKKGTTLLGVTGVLEEGISTYGSVEAMMSKPNVEEGEVALVYEEEFVPIEDGSYLETLDLPKTIVLDESAVELTGRIEYIPSPDVSWIIELGPERCRCWRLAWGMEETMFDYTSSDGVTFIRTTEANSFYFAEADSWRLLATNPLINAFIGNIKTSYEGVFKYNGTEWILLYSGAPIKVFDSVEDMQKDEDMKENDLAVVYTNKPVPWPDDDGVTNLYLPFVVILPEEVVDVENGIIATYTGEEVGQYTLTNDQFFIMVNSQTYTYGKTGDKHYTLNESIGTHEAVTFEFDEKVYHSVGVKLSKYFMQSKRDIFEGVYKATNNNDELTYAIAPSQLTLEDPAQLIKGVTAYGKNGVMTGTWEGNIKEFQDEEEMRATVTENRAVAAVYDYGNRWDMELDKYYDMLLFQPAVYLGEDPMEGNTEFRNITNMVYNNGTIIGTATITYNKIELIFDNNSMFKRWVTWERDPEEPLNWIRTKYEGEYWNEDGIKEIYPLEEDEYFGAYPTGFTSVEGDNGKWNILCSLILVPDKRYTAFYRHEWGNFVRIGLDNSVAKYEEFWQLEEFGDPTDGNIAVIYSPEKQVSGNLETRYYEQVCLPYSVQFNEPIVSDLLSLGLIPEDETLQQSFSSSANSNVITFTTEAVVDDVESILRVQYTSDDGSIYWLNEDALLAEGAFAIGHYSNTGLHIYTNITLKGYEEVSGSYDKYGGQLFLECIPKIYGGTYVYNGYWERIDAHEETPYLPPLEDLPIAGQMSYATLNTNKGTTHANEISSAEFTCYGGENDVIIDDNISLYEVSGAISDISLNTTNEFTIEYVATWWNTSNNAYPFCYGNYRNGFGIAFADYDNTTLRFINCGNEADIDGWSLDEKMVYTFVKSADSDEISLYMNGIYKTSLPRGEEPDETDYHITFNNEENISVQPLNQTIHACRVITTALGSDEILTRAQAYLGPNDGTSGPVEM